MWFDLIKPSNAISGAFILGPLISSDLKTICFGRPSKTIINLFGVENDELFLKEINSLPSVLLSKFGLPVKIKNRELEYNIKNFYMTDSISRSSVTMAKCSKEILDKVA